LSRCDNTAAFSGGTMGAEDLFGVKTLRRSARRYSSQRDEFHHHATLTPVNRLTPHARLRKQHSAPAIKTFCQIEAATGGKRSEGRSKFRSSRREEALDNDEIR
jgi:hypothetical protein